MSVRAHRTRGLNVCFHSGIAPKLGQCFGWLIHPLRFISAIVLLMNSSSSSLSLSLPLLHRDHSCVELSTNRVKSCIFPNASNSVMSKSSLFTNLPNTHCIELSTQFVSFAERFQNININVYHRVLSDSQHHHQHQHHHHVEDLDISTASTSFLETLAAVQSNNLTCELETVGRALHPYVSTLPLLLHHRLHVAVLLLRFMGDLSVSDENLILSNSSISTTTSISTLFLL